MKPVVFAISLAIATATATAVVSGSAALAKGPSHQPFCGHGLFPMCSPTQIAVWVSSYFPRGF